MPAYNAETYIGRAIESALAQTYSHWELIVVNDGSTDRTLEIVSRYNDVRIRVFNQLNGGEAQARNKALAHSQGKYIAFLDSDDEYLPEHLELTVDFLDEHPEVDGVYTDGYYINETNKRLKPLSARRRGPLEGDIFEPMVRASDVFGAPLCVVLKREPAARRELAFDPQIVIGPDWDFLTAYSEQSYFGRIDQKTCLYRVHQKNISLQTNKNKRLDSLARCREKSVHMQRFGECSIETREYIFYDLLVNLLAGNISGQEAVISWPQFSALPSSSKSRLYRLLASKVILDTGRSPHAQAWLRLAHEYAPQDKPALLLNFFYRINPGLCRTLLYLKHPRRTKLAALDPFADLG